jgi:hypothetical protein
MTTQMYQNLLARGFDATEHTRSRFARPKCSQCEVLVINGVACHETGCSNAVHECHGCNELIPMRQKYCAECYGLADTVDPYGRL